MAFCGRIWIFKFKSIYLQLKKNKEMDFKTYVPRYTDIVAAIQWDGKNKEEVIEFVEKFMTATVTFSDNDLVVHYGDGDAMNHIWVIPGWYLISHSNGMFDTMGPIKFTDFYKPEK